MGQVGPTLDFRRPKGTVAEGIQNEQSIGRETILRYTSDGCEIGLIGDFSPANSRESNQEFCEFLPQSRPHFGLGKILEVSRPIASDCGPCLSREIGQVD